MTNEAPPTLDDAKLKSFVLQYSDLSFEKIIGSGANGDVYIGTHIPSKKRVAIKKLHDSETITQNDLPFRREIYTLSVIKNPFLLPFVGFTKTSPFCIVTKFIPGGSLYSNLRKEIEEEDTKKIKISIKSKSKTSTNFLNPTDLSIIGLCIAKGMKYLHKINIIHRDLKTQNILLDEKKLPVICDFGTSRQFDILSNSRPAMTGQCGTPNYMAPEFIKNESYDQSVDVYSYGVILWEMLTRETPYGGKDAPQVIYMILSNKMLEIPEDTPENLKKLILSCWSIDPSHRPTFSQIVKMFLDGEVFYEGTNRKHFEKTVQSICGERKDRRPRTKTSSCEYQQTPVLNYMPSSTINNNNTSNINANNNNNNSNAKSNNNNVVASRNNNAAGARNTSLYKKPIKPRIMTTNNFIQFNDEDEEVDNNNNNNKNADDEDSKEMDGIEFEQDENDDKNAIKAPTSQSRPKIPKKAILSNEQRKNIAFRRHIAQLTTLYIRGIETGTDQQIRNSIAFIESHASDPALAKVEIWPKLLPVIYNSISSKPGIVPALQTLSLRLAESPYVLSSISSVQELHRFLRPETFDLFLYVVNFVPQVVTIQMINTLFAYSLPHQQQQEESDNDILISQSQNQQIIGQPIIPTKNYKSLNNDSMSSISSNQQLLNPFLASPKSFDSNQWKSPFNEPKKDISFSSSNDNLTRYQNGGFGSYQKSILEDNSRDPFLRNTATNESQQTKTKAKTKASNNSKENTSENKPTSGPSSMQIMSSQLSVTEKATILLCIILGQFQNNYEIRNHIIKFFVENAVKFADVNGGHLVLRTLLNNGLVTKEMFSSFSHSDIAENIIAVYSCIFSINQNSNQSQNLDSNLTNNRKSINEKVTNYVPNYFTLSQILEHMLSINPKLRNCAYEFIFRHGDHAANKPLLNITETLLKSIMMYHPNGTERAILLLCRIACDTSSNQILLQENVSSQWLLKMSPITAPPLMRLFVVLFKDEKLRYKMITSPQNESSSSISSSSSNSKHIHKYFENIAASNSHSDMKSKKGSSYLSDISEVKLNRMSAIFLSNVVKNGDNQAFLTVCWVLSQTLLNCEFVSILEDQEVVKNITEKFNATKNVYAIRVICAALMQISKGFLTYDSTVKRQSKHKSSRRPNNNNNKNQLLHSNSHSSDQLNNDVFVMNPSSDMLFENLTGNNNNNNNGNQHSLLCGGDSYYSDTNSFFSVSTSSPSFVSFNDASEIDTPLATANLTSHSSTNSPRYNSNSNLNQQDDSLEIVPVLKKSSMSFNRIVLTCLKLISERNEATKECLFLLASLSQHTETHDTLMKANCISVLSPFRNSDECVQPIKVIISQLKASGCIKNF
ncbi:hypothetical protein M9Y10_006179 [Tritrichomonas musculus]|uniref:Protein kinase domain-containing protein n=1 Tax=Tritrichomonas musculus TaxID=1915356 RepID=A0ABR2JF00_9EUKA